jgi:hypothetical protein
MFKRTRSIFVLAAGVNPEDVPEPAEKLVPDSNQYHSTRWTSASFTMFLCKL